MARLVAFGSEISRECAARHVGRHHHIQPYAAIVLRGGYVEAGDRGRFRAEPGAVLIHDWFEAHQDHFHAGGADILNLPLRHVPDIALAKVADPDRIVSLAEKCAADAAACLGEQIAHIGPGTSRTAESSNARDWPDLLAADLADGWVESLTAWADAAGLSPSSVSRGFRLAYGVSPQRFRAEQRASKAARLARQRRISLASLAADSGFADQPHMNRAIKRLFGSTPSRLRHVNCVQDGLTQGS